ncbi:hypothetical protein MMC19_002057 [Ptychographa xylographoides]|nr:hypothetical protein [Ptychographa xylographoides]
MAASCFTPKALFAEFDCPPSTSERHTGPLALRHAQHAAMMSQGCIHDHLGRAAAAVCERQIRDSESPGASHWEVPQNLPPPTEQTSPGNITRVRYIPYDEETGNGVEWSTPRFEMGSVRKADPIEKVSHTSLYTNASSCPPSSVPTTELSTPSIGAFDSPWDVSHIAYPASPDPFPAYKLDSLDDDDTIYFDNMSMKLFDDLPGATPTPALFDPSRRTTHHNNHRDSKIAHNNVLVSSEVPEPPPRFSQTYTLPDSTALAPNITASLTPASTAANTDGHTRQRKRHVPLAPIFLTPAEQADPVIKKRALNTVAARKSREKKQKLLEGLRVRVQELEAENRVLRAASRRVVEGIREEKRGLMEENRRLGEERRCLEGLGLAPGEDCAGGCE